MSHSGHTLLSRARNLRGDHSMFQAGPTPVSKTRKRVGEKMIILEREKGPYRNERKCIMAAAAASNDSAQPAPTAPEPSDLFSAFTGRKGWIAGIAITFLVPLLTGKLGPLQLFKDKFDSDLQKVEDVVEAMEKTAEGLDKVAEELTEKLPEGSPLRNVAKIVEHAAEEVARDAHLADAAIDKFQEIEEQAVVYLKEADKKNESKANIEQV